MNSFSFKLGFNLHKKKLTIVASIIVLLIAAILIYSGNPSPDKSEQAFRENSNVKLIDVDKIVENPEKYTGIVNVKGTVKEVVDKKKFFALGCEDACIGLPVAYKGELPKSESNIIALGEVKKDNNGKFFFDAKEIKYK